MASTTRNKPPLTSNLNRRAASTRSPTPTNGAPSPTPGGIARRNTIREGGAHHRSGSSISSPLSARSAAKSRPHSNDETELENAAILEDLRSRLAKSESAAEAAAEEYAKQIKSLQIRLEESIAEQVKMEESQHSRDEFMESLEMQIKDLTRSKRDQDNIYEAERTAAQQEKEELMDREEELNTIVQRLKDALSQKERNPTRERQNSFDDSPVDHESIGFAPSGHSPAPSQNSLVLQKDKLIESLRLELAEAQIRLAEADHMGGTKLHLLEQQLLEVRMTNARLMEENESFQLLLSTAAMNGDYPRGDYLTSAFSDPEPEMDSNVVKKVQGSPRNSMSLGNLAAELEQADSDEECDKCRKLENEIKLKTEQNKAMSLYINNIIERILQHKDSEAILDKTASPLGVDGAGSDKPLPPMPNEQPTRTKSLRNNDPKNGNTQIPLQRSQSARVAPSGHKRSHSDAGTNYTNGPGIYRREGMITPRANTFFGGATNDNYMRSRVRDSSASVDSGVSDTNTTETNSIPSPPHPPTSLGPIGGNKLRPLTLVQKNVNNGMMSPPLGGRKISGDYMDYDDKKTDRRNSKRGSWMGWFNRGKDEDQTHANSLASNVVFEGKDVE
ncbi:hypothetical protein EDC01DRAFT_720006 [Geopyxis carbonaria]|nr:hypothetical protein EDC01DRAFT_720006 [Geopyxis carbonaria]